MSEYCPYMSRMGVCLEPLACFLKHDNPMNSTAKEYVKEFLDPKLNQDPLESGMLFCKEHEDCHCCKGLFTVCTGEACKNLGMCFCMLADEDDLKNTRVEESKVLS